MSDRTIRRDLTGDEIRLVGNRFLPVSGVAAPFNILATLDQIEPGFYSFDPAIDPVDTAGHAGIEAFEHGQALFDL